MRQSTTNITREPPPTEGHKAADKVDLEPAKIKKNTGNISYINHLRYH